MVGEGEWQPVVLGRNRRNEEPGKASPGSGVQSLASKRDGGSGE